VATQAGAAEAENQQVVQTRLKFYEAITAMINKENNLQHIAYRKIFSIKLVFFLLLLSILYSLFSIPSSQAQQSGLISVSPNSADLKINEEKIIALNINSASKISGFDLKFQTSGPVGVVDFINDLGFNPAFDPFNVRQVNETIEGSNSRVAYIFTGSSANLPGNVTVYIKLSSSSSGQGKISLDYNNSQILDGSGQPLQVTPLTATFNSNPNQSSAGFIDSAALPKPTYADTTAVVNIKTKLYGAGVYPNGKIKAIGVIVGRIGEGKYETLPQGFDLISNSDGTFSGTVAFPNFKDGNKFSFMLKADKYLLRRICDTLPTEPKTGGYRCQTPSLTIRSGQDNTFDFTGIALLPGDLGISDGILNGYDLGIVRNNLGESDKENLGLADLNYDNVVDQKDFAIIQYVAGNTGRRADQ